MGVKRRGAWQLRNSNQAGPADLSFNYGLGCDLGFAAPGAITRSATTATPTRTSRPSRTRPCAHPTDGSTLDADALPRSIAELKQRGYGFVTIYDAI